MMRSVPRLPFVSVIGRNRGVDDRFFKLGLDEDYWSEILFGQQLAPALSDGPLSGG